MGDHFHTTLLVIGMTSMWKNFFTSRIHIGTYGIVESKNYDESMPPRMRNRTIFERFLMYREIRQTLTRESEDKYISSRNNNNYVRVCK